MKKILIVFGTRPEAIKMAPLVNELQNYKEEINTKVCVTAQHREMLDQVLILFGIKPDYDLNIMQSNQDLYDVTSRVLIGMRSVLTEAKPDIVLVHGDTSTSTAAALAAFYKQIPVGHIEAGLRTHNIYSPWPEEINRQLTGCLSTYHFAPTELGKKNLLKENILESSIFVTGNTVIDALIWVDEKNKNTPGLQKKLIDILIVKGITGSKIQSWQNEQDKDKICISRNSDNKQARKMILITGHRRENFGKGFVQICEAIKELALKFNEVDFVYPMHLNPNIRNTIKQVFGLSTNNNQSLSNVFFTEPLEYHPFVFLMSISYLIMTDSGGIQEEAPGLGKPVLVMRNTTERPEALDAGTVKLVGTDKEKIINEVSRLINDNDYYKKMAMANNPYGDGKACKRIVAVLKNI